MWYKKRNNRTLRYAGRVLEHDKYICITADNEYLYTYEGQVLLITLTNLLSRMTPSVVLDIPDVVVHENIPWKKYSLKELILNQMKATDPYGSFSERGRASTDYVIHLGVSLVGADVYVNSSGWNAYIGTEASRLPESPSSNNPIGAALAAISAVSQVFVSKFQEIDNIFINGLNWKNEIITGYKNLNEINIGKIWYVGVGSVGTAAIYFMGLTKLQYMPVLIDKDKVKIHNLDRSPIFVNADVGRSKVDAAHDYLKSINVDNILKDAVPLHMSDLWLNREKGVPDVLVSAANELNIRYHIESQYPPLQIYGTTGRNWQASFIRHTPFVESCSCCLFPPKDNAITTVCSEGKNFDSEEVDNNDDISLPFLSFLAGLMAAAEMMKLSLSDYPFTGNRITVNTRSKLRSVESSVPIRPNCICQSRSKKVHAEMIRGSQYVDKIPNL